MKKLVRTNIDCGRMGSLTSLEIFSEDLGKHSDFESPVSGLRDGIYDFDVISEDQERIEWLEGVMGGTHCGGNCYIVDAIDTALKEYS